MNLKFAMHRGTCFVAYLHASSRQTNLRSIPFSCLVYRNNNRKVSYRSCPSAFASVEGSSNLLCQSPRDFVVNRVRKVTL